MYYKVLPDSTSEESPWAWLYHWELRLMKSLTLKKSTFPSIGKSAVSGYGNL